MSEKFANMKDTTKIHYEKVKEIKVFNDGTVSKNDIYQFNRLFDLTHKIN